MVMESNIRIFGNYKKRLGKEYING